MSARKIEEMSCHVSINMHLFSINVQIANSSKILGECFSMFPKTPNQSIVIQMDEYFFTFEATQMLFFSFCQNFFFSFFVSIKFGFLERKETILLEQSPSVFGCIYLMFVT